MAEPDRTTSRPDSGASAADAPRRRPGLLLPFLALLLGLALGAGLMRLATADQEQARPAPAAAPTSTPVPPPATVPAGPGQVVVPGSCLQISEEAQKLNGVLADGVQAGRDLNASALSAIVRDFGASQETLRRLTDDCRSGTGQQVTSPTAAAATVTTAG